MTLDGLVRRRPSQIQFHRRDVSVALTMSSTPPNPFSDASGDIRVRRGVGFPAIPKRPIKGGREISSRELVGTARRS